MIWDHAVPSSVRKKTNDLLEGWQHAANNEEDGPLSVEQEITANENIGDMTSMHAHNRLFGVINSVAIYYCQIFIPS